MWVASLLVLSFLVTFMPFYSLYLCFKHASVLLVTLQLNHVLLPQTNIHDGQLIIYFSHLPDRRFQPSITWCSGANPIDFAKEPEEVAEEPHLVGEWHTDDFI